MIGRIFNLQPYSVHDGPGIRMTVFTKGCPLRCLWCSNPESQEPFSELAFNAGKCIAATGCRRCPATCPQQAIQIAADASVSIDRSRCDGCLQCVGACPPKAMVGFGASMSIDEILHRVERDALFYARSAGGLTVSGGEPLLQADFVAALLQAARRLRIHTALETCGQAAWSCLERVCHHLDTLIYDVKCIDTDKHAAFTGVGNERILRNLLRVRKTFPALSITVRTPLVPGFNDNEEEVNAIVDWVAALPGVSHEWLPYHRMGQPKYGFLGRPYALASSRLDEQHAARLIAGAQARFAARLAEEALPPTTKNAA